MKVKELIKLLQKYHEESEVCLVVKDKKNIDIDKKNINEQDDLALSIKKIDSLNKDIFTLTEIECCIKDKKEIKEDDNGIFYTLFYRDINDLYTNKTLIALKEKARKLEYNYKFDINFQVVKNINPYSESLVCVCQHFIDGNGEDVVYIGIVNNKTEFKSFYKYILQEKNHNLESYSDWRASLHYREKIADIDSEDVSDYIEEGYDIDDWIDDNCRQCLYDEDYDPKEAFYGNPDCEPEKCIDFFVVNNEVLKNILETENSYVEYDENRVCKLQDKIAKTKQNVELNERRKKSIYFGTIGSSLVQLGNEEDAIKNFNKAIEIDPTNEVAYYNRGNANKTLKNYNLAVDDFNRTIQINPLYAKAYYNRGYAYKQQKKYNESIRDFNKAIELEPNNCKAYVNRALIKEKLNYTDEEILNDYNKAIEFDSKYVFAYFCRGKYYFKRNMYKDSIEDFSKVINFDSKDIDAYLYIGDANLRIGNYETALEYYKKTLDLSPTNYLVCSKIGRVKMLLKQYSKAFKYYEKALNLCSNDKDKNVVYVGIANLKEKMGDYSGAIKFCNDLEKKGITSKYLDNIKNKAIQKLEKKIVKIVKY